MMAVPGSGVGARDPPTSQLQAGPALPEFSEVTV